MMLGCVIDCDVLR